VILCQSRRLGLFVCFLALALSLAGCARNGPLETPSAAAEKDQNQANGANTTNAGPKSDSNSPIPSPFKKQTSYPLDPLL
jgi:predicted small lipoprotein YifL